MQQLKDIAQITMGLNSQKLKLVSAGHDTYTAEDLSHDLTAGYQGEYKPSESGLVNAGDVVFNSLSQTAAVVSEENAGKAILQSVLKFQIDRSKIDPWYLCYVLNESQSIKHQLHKRLEGTVMKLLTSTTAKKLNIELPDFAVQQRIGRIYSQMLVNNQMQREYIAKSNAAILEILRIEDKNN